MSENTKYCDECFKHDKKENFIMCELKGCYEYVHNTEDCHSECVECHKIACVSDLESCKYCFGKVCDNCSFTYNGECESHHDKHYKKVRFHNLKTDGNKECYNCKKEITIISYADFTVCYDDYCEHYLHYECATRCKGCKDIFCSDEVKRMRNGLCEHCQG